MLYLYGGLNYFKENNMHQFSDDVCISHQFCETGRVVVINPVVQIKKRNDFNVQLLSCNAEISRQVF